MALADIEQYVIDKVRAKRLELNWTQKDLSAVSGLSQGFIGDVESGKRRKKRDFSGSFFLYFRIFFYVYKYPGKRNEKI